MEVSNIGKSKEFETNVLVIRLSAMGDIAMTVPVLRVFRATYPDVKLTVLTRKFFEPIFSDIENLEVYHADVDHKHKGFIGLTRLTNELNKLKINAVADLHNVLRSNVLKTLFSLRGIKTVQVDKGREEKKALTRSKNKAFKQLKTTHQRYADVFSALGYPIDLTTHKFPKKQPLTPEILSITQNSTKKWLGIAPFAQYESKTYPLELMIEVIETLNKEDGFEIFLFGGGKREMDILNNIESKYKNVTNIVGKLSFEDELKLIGNLDAMLSMDSGNAHLAAMYGVPTITLWGVTHPFTGFMPFGQPMERAILPNLAKYDQIPTSIYGNKVPPGYEKVMHTIKPETVVDKINKL
ncbi:ADP-heptose:LPS heptosyltransferase [Aquimarina sp. MAR_2010_214]|uniref:glycosyltransferase family 9 protein n=1 Tax=Aquimarina sp. MAR_2010_214 TaxID=1250026 RepID=UPI000CAF682D|nr:glycosyltransferase family 9 protein [Aquimarina sp. MAR_2010_214]PKV48800.1 ADP-heptose:LPS heptosyltransferase [Aquimarina sp. MAR_2010_214]